ncbi:MAG: hypothetical protein WAR57_01455 [Candidatus Phosphoribacter sp.]|nr:hypothetical protein [Actinomycetales bacterium]
MSMIEDRLREALADPVGAVGSRPSPDLFERVALSIADDLERRRRRRWLTLWWVSAGFAATAAIAIFTPRDEKGLHMPWWILEVATTAVLVAIAVWLGPFIKRFGRAYAADVFHDNPLTGKSYIVLTDIVYYLIFTAYILFTVRVEGYERNGWYAVDATAAQLQEELAKIGGILLIIGALHGLNIVLMPLLGRIFSLNRRVD